MFGLVGRIECVPGRKEELVSILLEIADQMPGCLSYVVAGDKAEPDSIWITEVWVDQQSHDDSLKIPEVLAAIQRGKPLIAGFSSHNITEPYGGKGI